MIAAIGPSGTVQVVVATKPVDVRKGMEGLAMLVREHSLSPARAALLDSSNWCVTVFIYSHKRSTQLEVVETGRRRRWSDDEKLRIVTENRSPISPR